LIYIANYYSMWSMLDQTGNAVAGAVCVVECHGPGIPASPVSIKPIHQLIEAIPTLLGGSLEYLNIFGMRRRVQENSHSKCVLIDLCVNYLEWTHYCLLGKQNKNSKCHFCKGIIEEENWRSIYCVRILSCGKNHVVFFSLPYRYYI
jgi:hypothetical protein